MKFSRIQLIEISSVILAIISGLMLLGSFAFMSYALIVFAGICGLIWFISTFLKSEYGRIPWFTFIFSIPLLLTPIGISLKLSIVNGGAFILFVGLVLAVMAIAAIFFLILTIKDYLKYLKNVSIRLVPVTALGIVIYFTPQLRIIQMVYADNPQKMKEYEDKLLYPYSAKTKKVSIAFVSSRSGDSDILEINPDGTGLRPLVNGESNQWLPRVDVNGEFLYYLDDKGDETALYKKDLRTDSTHYLKAISFDDFYYHLHPEMEKIIAHDTINGFFQLFIHDLSNNSVKQLTFDSCNSKKPMFFSDGNRVVFQSDCAGNDDIFILNLENDSLINLTNSEFNERNPSLSPYDDVVVYHSDKDSLKRINLHYMIIETGEAGMLTNSPGMELLARFSPNAKDLVFGSNRDDNWEIYIMSNEGEFKDRLTNHPAFDGDAIYINRSYLKK